MNDAPAAPNTAVGPDAAEWAWVVIGSATFVSALAVAYRPSLDGPADVAMAVVPWMAAIGMIVGMSGLVVRSPLGLRLAGVAVALAAWALLMFEDDRWSIASFSVYVVCYSVWGERPLVGVTLTAVATAVWIAAWAAADAPAWTTIIPLGVFGVGSAIALSIHRAGRLNAEQRRLIEQLQATRADLAESERSKGVLEERARMAGEIHDTLAQGYTSIVLLSRAARRSGGGSEQLGAIEAIAQENLDASRRLIDAMRPPELEVASLADAVERHVASAATNGLVADFGVAGVPRPLPGSVEVTILRAAQELTANVTAHAHAQRMEVTLSYLDDAVVLDVCDDGVGFTSGAVADRGSLTGGQGIDALTRRAESLGGRLVVDGRDDGGSSLSLVLPVGDA